MRNERRKYYTLVDRDIGRNHLKAFDRVWLVSDFMGRVREGDVGKRVYLVDNEARDSQLLQVESNEQREARLKGYKAMMRREPVCECTDTACLNAANHDVPAGFFMDEDCGQPAVMHLFQVAMMVHSTPLVEGRPVDFCDGCGDNALQSGAFATDEDVAAARREAEPVEPHHGPGNYDPPEADLEKDWGNGGLGSGRWLEEGQQ